MIRKEFIDIVTNTGMATLKELRRLSMGKDDEVNEFELLAMPYFDENKFAKVCSERFSMTFIDLRNAMSSAPSAGTTKASAVMNLRDDLADQEDTILSALSRAGTIQYRLETVQKDLELRYESSEKLISTDADVDFAEATVRLNRSQMAYQAAIQSGAKIQNNSLLDYLR